MNQRIIEEQAMMKRVSRFIFENSITPPIARVAELSEVISSAIASIDSAAGLQAGGSGESAGGVVARRDQYRELRAYMKDVARVGRALNRVQFPGVAAQFVLPDTRSYPALIAKARAMITVATELEAAFVARGLPATFLADLGVLITAFESATNMKMDGQRTQVEGTASLKLQASLGMEAAIELDAIMRAHFRDDPVTLAVWVHARHVRSRDEQRSEGGSDTPADSESESGVSATAAPGKVNGATTAIGRAASSRGVEDHSRILDHAEFSAERKVPNEIVSVDD